MPTLAEQMKPGPVLRLQAVAVDVCTTFQSSDASSVLESTTPETGSQDSAGSSHLTRICTWHTAIGFGCSVQFSLVQCGSYALGKAHIMRSTPSHRSFPQRCLWNSSNVRLIDDGALSRPFKENRLTDDGPLSSFQGRSSSASSFHASLRLAIDSVMSLALSPQVVSQAPQHITSSEKQATCEGCFAYQCICSVISFHSGMSRAVHPKEFSKVDVDH